MGETYEFLRRFDFQENRTDQVVVQVANVGDTSTIPSAGSSGHVEEGVRWHGGSRGGEGI